MNSLLDDSTLAITNKNWTKVFFKILFVLFPLYLILNFISAEGCPQCYNNGHIYRFILEFTKTNTNSLNRNYVVIIESIIEGTIYGFIFSLFIFHSIKKVIEENNISKILKKELFQMFIIIILSWLLAGFLFLYLGYSKTQFIVDAFFEIPRKEFFKDGYIWFTGAYIGKLIGVISYISTIILKLKNKTV